MKNNSMLNIHLYLNKKFNTVFDFGYTLIDLQAVFSSFLYTLDIEVPNDIYDINKQKDSQKIEIAAMGLKKETERKKKNKGSYIGNLPTTSRRFSKNYGGILRVIKIEKGSLILDVASNLLAGLLLKFIEKIIFSKGENNNNFNVNINYNNNIEIDNSRFVDIEEKLFVDGQVIKDINNPEKYINKIISKVSIEPNNFKKNIINFLDVLKKEKVLNKNQIYDERGILSLSNDIKRLTGQFVDVSA